MAKLVNDVKEEYCFFKDLKDGEMGIIEDQHCIDYLGMIVIKVSGRNIVQALGYLNSWLLISEKGLRIRKLKEGEIIKVIDYDKLNKQE